jgi:hypothetical protein
MVSHIYPNSIYAPNCVAFQTVGDGTSYGVSVNDPAAAVIAASLSQSEITGRPVYFDVNNNVGAPFHAADCTAGGINYIVDFAE